LGKTALARLKFLWFDNYKDIQVNLYKVGSLVTPKSGVFLAGSCVAAIAAVGSIFELSSGQPQLGSVVTSVILVLAVPLTGIFFYAAVQDARANQ
jgi:hypothetical protein